MLAASFSESLFRKAEFFAQVNHNSPLEFYLGVNEFRKQNFSESAELLELVLEKFPDHNAAKILLCSAYAKIDKFHQSVTLLRSVCTEIHSSQTLDFYLKQIEKNAQAEMPEDKSKVSLEYELKPHNSNFESAFSIDPDGLKNYIASETLAKIYISQGEFAEAIAVYEQLIARKPENKENYLQRIEGLKTRLEK